MVLIAKEWFENGLEQFDKLLGACKVMCENLGQNHMVSVAPNQQRCLT